MAEGAGHNQLRLRGLDLVEQCVLCCMPAGELPDLAGDTVTAEIPGNIGAGRCPPLFIRLAGRQDDRDGPGFLEEGDSVPHGPGTFAGVFPGHQHSLEVEGNDLFGWQEDAWAAGLEQDPLLDPMAAIGIAIGPGTDKEIGGSGFGRQFVANSPPQA